MKTVLPTLSGLMEAAQSDEYMGFCLACGAPAYGVEPDARRYLCEACGEPRVYGAEELCLLELYRDDAHAGGAR